MEPLSTVLVIMAVLWAVIRMERLMADFTKLTAAVAALATEVDVAVAKIGTPPAEDPAIQTAIDTATTAVATETAKLAAAAPPPAPPTP